MSSTLRSDLLTAGHLYAECARRIDATVRTAGGLDLSTSEQIVGVGVAGDWVRQAAHLENIEFANRFDRSRWKQSFCELVRFGFSWSGLNAIFSRKTLLNPFGTPKSTSELDRLRLIFDKASIPDSVLKSRLAVVHGFLNRVVATRLPHQPPGGRSTVLAVIYSRYVPEDAQTKGVVGKAILASLHEADLSRLDLPVLIYALRNWSVHGNALHGCFGSRPQYLEYVTLLAETLANVHVSTANLLHSYL